VKPMKTNLVLCCALVVPLLGDRSVLAADAAADEPARLAEAERACLSGNYQRGVELLAELYLTTRHPAYLHNQARCYEQNGQYRLAAGRYREFLRKLQDLPADQVSAETSLTPEKIAAIEANAAKLDRLAQDGDRGPAPVKAESPPPLLRETAATPDAGGGLRVSGIVAISLGALAAGGGGLAGVLARKAEADISAASGRGNQRFDAALYDRGRLMASLATVGLIAGPSLVVAGALLYWRGAAARPSDRVALTLMPALSPGTVGAVLGGRY
jgi:hypothetical protein